MKYFFTILLAILSFQTLQATHIVGGELNYRCLGNDQYEISLTVFRDCFNGIPPFDNPAAIGVFDSSNQLIQFRLPIPQGNDTLNPVLFDSCLVIPPNVCVHRTSYIDTITLPFLAGGYQLVYQRCCRNNTIVNIENPSSTGATYYAYVSEEALLQCNSNPVFKEWPPIYICAGEPILFDHSATDIDGDSLVYALCTPFDGASVQQSMPQPPNPPPYDSITWTAPFSLNDMMGGVPLAIDPMTGLLTGTPVQIGQYVVGVCVKEYRNGILISETRRDFQYNVGTCSKENEAVFNLPSLSCDSSLTISPINTSLGGSTNYFWDFGDVTTNDTTSQFQPTYTYSDTGQYIIQLIAGYNEACPDTISQLVSIQRNTLNGAFSLNYNECEANPIVEFMDESTDAANAIVQWNWDFSHAMPSTLQSPTIQFSGSELYEIRLVVTAENGCQDVVIDSFRVYPIEIFASADSQLCRGSEMLLNVQNLDSTDSLSYTWFPIEDILLGGDTEQAIVAPFDLDTFWVEAVNDEGCVESDTLIIPINTNAPNVEITANRDSVFAGEEVQLIATLGNYIYEWLPANSLNNSTIFNPIATPILPTAYVVKVTDENGCVNLDTIFIRLRQFQCAEPNIFIPNAFTPNNDGHNDILRVRANSLSEFYFAVYNRFGEKVFESNNPEDGWDGTFKGSVLAPEVFGYYIEIKCLGGETYFKKGNVTLIR